MSQPPRPRLVAVLLAAGAARRYGRAKQVEVLDGDGKTLVRGAAEAALAVTDDVIVVTGGHADAVEAAVRGLPAQVLRCADWALGMGHSMACAFRALLERAPPERADAALLCLCDQPRVREPQLRRLVDAARAAPDRIVIADYGNAQRGPPAIFPAAFHAALTQLNGDEGARGLIRKYRDQVIAIALPEAAVDIDTPDDAARLAPGDA